VDLVTIHADRIGGRDPETDFVAMDGDDANTNLAIDHDCLIEAACENQHEIPSLYSF